MPIGYIHMPAKITDSLSFRSASSASSFRAGTSCPSGRSVRPRCQAAIPSPVTMVMTSIWGRSFWAATVARLEEDTPAITLTLIPVAFSKGSNMLCWNALPQTPPQVAMTTSCATAGATGRPPITATSVRHESASFVMYSLPLGSSDAQEAVEADAALDHERRRHRHPDQRRRDGGDGRVEVPLHVLVDRHRERLHVRPDEEDRHREVVERHDEGEERAGEDAGADDRQRDAPEHVPRPAAQAARRLVERRVVAGERGRHGPHHVGEGDEHVADHDVPEG